MPQLEGVRIGPLDPDKGERFGQVGSTNSARQLIRHHQAMHPPALVAALGLKRHDERTEALDRTEAAGAIVDYYEEADEALPDGARITGIAVRGEDDGVQQFVTFSWVVPVEEGGSGRSGKGCMPYTEDRLPQSVKRGADAVRIHKLKTAGLPWGPSEVPVARAEDPAIAEERDRLSNENGDLTKELEETKRRLEEATQALARAADTPPPAPPTAGQPAAPPTTPPVELAVPEPWSSYDELNSDDVKSILKEHPDRAENVLAYESAHKNRAGVVGAANAILDRGGS